MDLDDAFAVHRLCNIFLSELWSLEEGTCGPTLRHYVCSFRTCGPNMHDRSAKSSEGSFVTELKWTTVSGEFVGHGQT